MDVITSSPKLAPKWGHKSSRKFLTVRSFRGINGYADAFRKESEAHE